MYNPNPAPRPGYVFDHGNYPGVDSTDQVIDIQQPMTPMDEGAQIQMAYQQFLGRPASPEEIQNWLSGTYGHGRSGNLMPIFEAIRQSGEAQQRPPLSLPPMPMPGSPNQFPPKAGPSGSPWDMTGRHPTSLPPGAMTFAGPRPRGPMSGQQTNRMRKAILGVPEY